MKTSDITWIRIRIQKRIRIRIQPKSARSTDPDPTHWLERVFGIGRGIWSHWRGCLELEGVFEKYTPHPLKINSGVWKIWPNEVIQYEWCYYLNREGHKISKWTIHSQSWRSGLLGPLLKAWSSYTLTPRPLPCPSPPLPLPSHKTHLEPHSEVRFYPNFQGRSISINY